MKIFLPLSMACAFVFLSLDSIGQSEISNEIILELEEFTSEKNMALYSLFRSDPDVRVVNSCDALGMLIIESSGSIPMTKEGLKSYLQVRVPDVLEEDTFRLRDDLTKMQVLVDCRAATLELYEVEE